MSAQDAEPAVRPHIHYAWPHESIPCERIDCPEWLPARLPDGRCDAPECSHCRGETEYLFGRGTKRHIARGPGDNVSRCGLILDREDEMAASVRRWGGSLASIDRKRAAAVCRLCARSEAP